MKCANKECGKEFTPKRDWQKYCCDHCRERGEYLVKLADGRIEKINAKKRARRREAAEERRERESEERAQRMMDRSSEGVSKMRRAEIEWEMQQPREELMRLSQAWTKAERRFAQKAWERKFGLFNADKGRGLT